MKWYIYITLRGHLLRCSFEAEYRCCWQVMYTKTHTHTHTHSHVYMVSQLFIVKFLRNLCKSLLFLFIVSSIPRCSSNYWNANYINLTGNILISMAFTNAVIRVHSVAQWFGAWWYLFSESCQKHLFRHREISTNKPTPSVTIVIGAMLTVLHVTYATKTVVLGDICRSFSGRKVYLERATTALLYATNVTTRYGTRIPRTRWVLRVSTTAICEMRGPSPENLQVILSWFTILNHHLSMPQKYVQICHCYIYFHVVYL